MQAVVRNVVGNNVPRLCAGLVAMCCFVVNVGAFKHALRDTMVGTVPVGSMAPPLKEKFFF